MDDFIQFFNGFYNVIEKEQSSGIIQIESQERIKLRKRMMKSGAIEFDEYEEVK
jgi:hypothetical protein